MKRIQTDNIFIFFLLSIVCLEYCKDSPKSTSAFKELESSRLETYPNTSNYKKEGKEHFTDIQYCSVHCNDGRELLLFSTSQMKIIRFRVSK